MVSPREALMLSCLRRMDCMLHITICKDTREGHLRVAKPEDPPSVGTKNAFGKMCVTNCGKSVSDEGGVADYAN